MGMHCHTSCYHICGRRRRGAGRCRHCKGGQHGCLAVLHHRRALVGAVASSVAAYAAFGGWYWQHEPAASIDGVATYGGDAPSPNLLLITGAPRPGCVVA